MSSDHRVTTTLVAALLELAVVISAGNGQCGDETITSASGGLSGYVSSPGFPIGYPGRQRCRYNLTADRGYVVHLTFTDFDLADRYSGSKQCLTDYILLTVIDYEGRKHVGQRYCERDMPPAVRTLQSSVEVTFVSTHASARRGFRFQYRFVPEEEILQPASLYYDADTRWKRDCGGHVDPESIDGEITSPGFPATFPRNVTCNWLIRVPADKRIYIRLVHLELSATMAECERVSLFIMDGYKAELLESPTAKRWMSEQSGAEVRFCGGQLYYNEEGMKSYLSQGNRVLVRFETRDSPTPEQLTSYDLYGMPIGFKLLWTEVNSLVSEDDPDEPPCNGFTCRGGEFCIDDGQNICAERTRLCINETLQCNGVSNCAENDNSDELNCYSNHIAATAGISVTALLAVILILVVVHRATMRREIRSRLRDRARKAKQAHAEASITVTATSNNNHARDTDVMVASSRVSPSIGTSSTTTNREPAPWVLRKSAVPPPNQQGGGLMPMLGLTPVEEGEGDDDEHHHHLSAVWQPQVSSARQSPHPPRVRLTPIAPNRPHFVPEDDGMPRLPHSALV